MTNVLRPLILANNNHLPSPGSLNVETSLNQGNNLYLSVNAAPLSESMFYAHLYNQASSLNSSSLFSASGDKSIISAMQPTLINEISSKPASITPASRTHVWRPY